jgi:hypothetical protein
MVQIPLLSGIYANEKADFRSSYPTNLEPVLVDSGVSKGYLRASPGISALAMGSGADRGGYAWKGTHFRAMGGKLVSVAGSTVNELADLAGVGPVTFDDSFDLLGIAAGGSLYYWDGSSISQVTDPDLGTVIDFIWIDGYFMTTDGTSLVVTELNDPYSVDPLKYGSSEAAPDPVTGLIKVRNEAYALNRYTIENFQNRGGTGFPFQRNPGGMIPKGCVGTYAKTAFLETFAFVGSGWNEGLGVYLAGGGTTARLSTPEIEDELAALTDAEAALIEVEAREENAEQRLYVHLPTKTLVYLHQVSEASKELTWQVLAAGTGADEAWPLRHLTLVNGQWVGGDAVGRLGYLDSSVETQFGAVAGWQFDTVFIYNASLGCIIHQLELVGLPGRTPFGEQPTLFMSYTTDGERWSDEKAVSMGRAGQRQTRVQWLPGIYFQNYLGLRFRGANTAIASWARCEAKIEGLGV